MIKRIVFAVTNDLSFDQRMIRICNSLSSAGYHVTLVGRKKRNSPPLFQQQFEQKRLSCLFNQGKIFYIEYNFRLFVFLLFKKTTIIGAIDLDTILACYLVSVIKRTERIYDAHELFCEMKEIVSRPLVYKCWKWLERKIVPRFTVGYTVNQPIAEEFNNMYGLQYAVIRNVPLYQPLPVPDKKEKYIIYQGAVNEGRCFETLIPAMKDVNAQLIICGDGNFMAQAKELAGSYNLENKIIFKGNIVPSQLTQITADAWAGVTLFDAVGKSNYYSLANRFFDYIQAGIPQLCVNYPVYKEINNQYSIAVLTDDLSPAGIAHQLNKLLNNQELYNKLQAQCLVARKHLCWQEEEKKLISYYQKQFTN